MQNLLEDLQDAGFSVESSILESVNSGDVKQEFVNLASSMVRELGLLLATEETVTPIDSLEGLTNWKMEMSSFLRETKCPHVFLCEGDLDKRLQSSRHQFVLLDFLLSEILMARITNFAPASSEVQSSTASQLSASIKALNLASPPANITADQFFSQLIKVIENIPETVRGKLIGKSLFTGGSLDESQWQLLNQVAMSLEQEYTIRRTMLITRLSATLQSFSWSEKVTSRMPSSISDAISIQQFSQSSFTHVNVADALAARSDLATIAKVSSVPPESRSQNALTKVKVGRVPDRGGRPNEQAPPPPEMPSWQQRSGQAHNASNFQGGRGGFQNKGGGYQGDRGHQRGHDRGHQRGHDRGYRGGSDERRNNRGGDYRGDGHDWNRGAGEFKRKHY